MLAVPFADRLARLDKEVEEHNDAIGKIPGDKLERLTWEVQRALVASNISNPKYFKSLPRVAKG